MPIYEYTCEECGNEFELLVFRNDEPECPQCGSKKPVKKMSSFGFSVNHQFKSASTGSGGGCAGCTSSNCSSCSS
jgi:putative FmdB family regulatory protein